MLEIKVSRIEDGPAKVELGNTETGETVETTEVNVGQEVKVTVPADTQISVGEVCQSQPTDETASSTGGEAATSGDGEQAEASQTGGEAEGAGGGSASE